MIVIIAIFIICHTPDRIYQILRHVSSRANTSCGGYLFYFAYVCNLLIIVSSSSNFIVYYMFRKRFRKILWQKLFGWYKKNKNMKRRESTATENLRLNETCRTSLADTSIAACETSKVLFITKPNGVDTKYNGSMTILPD